MDWHNLVFLLYQVIVIMAIVHVIMTIVNQ